MDVEKVYLDVVKALELGDRPQLPLTRDEAWELGHYWERALLEGDARALERSLCLAAHAQGTWPMLGRQALKTLEGPWEARLLVLGLWAVAQQVLAHTERTGDPPPPELVPRLRALLAHPEAEVVEWCLRTVDLLGGRSLEFRDDVAALRPSLWQSLDPHKRAIRQIVDMLQKRWGCD